MHLTQPAGDVCSAQWAASEGLEALARLVQPVGAGPASVGCQQGMVRAAVAEGDPWDCAAQRLVADLVPSELGSQAAVGALRQLRDALPELQ